MAVAAFTVAPEFGDPPDAELVSSDLRRALEGRLDVAERLERRMRGLPGGAGPVPVAPPKVTLLDDASRTATVVEVRAHDAPGLLWRIGRALGDCGLDVRAARVETLGAEAVDVFYVVDVRWAGRRVRIRGRSPPRCWPPWPRVFFCYRAASRPTANDRMFPLACQETFSSPFGKRWAGRTIQQH